MVLKQLIQHYAVVSVTVTLSYTTGEERTLSLNGNQNHSA